MTNVDQLVIVEQLVLQEHKIVTYGWLSRYLNIHVNKAKQLLYEFIANCKSSKENNVHAIYCICGLTADNRQHTVTLVTQEKLEAARKGFTRLTSLHVYSVQPACPTEAELIMAGREPIDKVGSESALNANKDVSSTTSVLVSQPINVKESSTKPEKVDGKERAKSKSTSSEKSTAITKNTFLKENQFTNKQNDITSFLNKAASQDKSKDLNKKEEKRKSDEIDSNHSEDSRGSKEEQTTDDKASDITSLLNKATSQDELTSKKEKKRKSDESNHDGVSKEELTTKKSKKQITGKQKDDKDSDITSPLNKASQNELKVSNKKSKKRKSDEAIDELDVKISEEKAVNKQEDGKGLLWNKTNSRNKVTTKDKVVKKRKNKVADDLDQQEVEAPKINERKDDVASLLNKVDKTEQQLEVSDNLDINNDKQDQSQDKLSAALVRPDQQSALPTTQQKKRGRRQTLKSRSYVNERGYTVHENYHEWESFSEDESVSAKKPQKAIKEELNITAKRGKKKKGDNGSQKSLLNFFGRK